jgi:hypothetical protein
MMCALHQQKSQIRVPLFADVQLRLTLAGVAPARPQAQIAAHVTAVLEALRIFDRQNIRQCDQCSDSIYLLQQCSLG